MPPGRWPGQGAGRQGPPEAREGEARSPGLCRLAMSDRHVSNPTRVQPQTGRLGGDEGTGMSAPRYVPRSALRSTVLGDPLGVPHGVQCSSYSARTAKTPRKTWSTVLVQCSYSARTVLPHVQRSRTVLLPHLWSRLPLLVPKLEALPVAAPDPHEGGADVLGGEEVRERALNVAGVPPEGPT